MNAIEHKGNEAFQVSTLVDPENDPMSIRSLFNKAANAVIDASSLRGEVQALRDDVQGLRDTVNRLVRERDEMKSERDKAIENAKYLEDELTARTSMFMREKEQLIERLDRRADTLSAMEAERDSLKEQLHHVVAERDTLASEAVTRHNEHAETRAKFEATTADLNSARSVIDTKQLSIWELEDKARKDSEKIGHLVTETDHQRALITSHEATIATLKEDVAHWKTAFNDVDVDCRNVKGKLSDISAILAQ